MQCYISSLLSLFFFFSLSLVIVVILNCYSVKLTARVMVVLSFMKLLACGFVIVLGLGQLIANGKFPPSRSYLHPANRILHSQCIYKNISSYSFQN